MSSEVLLVEPFEYEPDILQGELHISLLTLGSTLLERSRGTRDVKVVDLKVEQKRGNLTPPKRAEDRDSFNEDLSRVLDRLEVQPGVKRVVGITCLTSKQFGAVVEIARAFRTCFPGDLIVVGGYHPTFVPQDFQSPEVRGLFDFVVVGEGELTFSDLVLGFDKSGSLPSSTLVVTGKTPEDLDALPPLDFSIYEEYLPDYRSTSLCLSRGCPYDCKFCVENNYRRVRGVSSRLRLTSPDVAARQLEQMVQEVQEFGITNFGFFDPCFAWNRRWRERFLQAVATSEVVEASSDEIAIWGETRVDVVSPEELAKFQEVGINLFFGLESGSKHVLTLMNKTNHPGDYLERAKRLMERAGILEFACSLGIIHNFPGETAEFFDDTVRFNEELVKLNASAFISPSLFQNFPGTHVYDHMGEYAERFGTTFYFPRWWDGYREHLRFRASCIDACRRFKMIDVVDRFFPSYEQITTEITKQLIRKGIKGGLLRGAQLIRQMRSQATELREFLESNLGNVPVVNA
ncbi:MAG: hypothetical protein Kow0069_34410 [Promethearchaeota archaeon]